MKKQISLNRKELQEYINKESKKIIGTLLSKKQKQINEQNKLSNRLTNSITEKMMRKMGIKKPLKLTESTDSGLWAEIIFVQGGDDIYDEIGQMFCGNQDGYCETNSQAVIDYLKQWDDGENGEVTPNQPRIARYDTSYRDENGVYTLLYNSTVGGDFLLYRPASSQEIAWYNDNGPGSMGESKKYGLKESVAFDIYA